jgi:hypothetical protein
MLRFTSGLWQLLPKLRFVQFPWRWMSILTIPFVYFLAAAVARRRFRWLWVVASAALLASTAVFLVQHTWWDDEDFATLHAAFASGEGFDGTDEYDPIGDDHYNLPQKAARVHLLPITDDADAQDSQLLTNSKVFVDQWTAQEKIMRVQSSQPTRLALRLLNYPAWQVEVNGARIQPQHPEDSGQMIVAIPAGESRITVRLGRTLDRTVGSLLSLLSLLAAASLLTLRPPARQK